jgi:hypothetical protein
MRHPAFLTTPAPSVAVGIEAGHLAAITMTRTPEGALVGAHAVEPLPAGAIVPALSAANIVDRTAVVEALRRAFERLGVKPRRVGLVIPDTAGKVSIVKFEKVPTRADDLDQLIRFHVRKTAPFRIEDAQISFTPGAAPPGGGREFVVVLTRRDIVEEYEAVCTAAGAHAGLVDLATLNVINMVLVSAEAPSGDWLLVHVAPEYATMAILRGPDLIFFRNRADEADGNLADLTHQTAMYYEDRLGGTGFARVLLAGAGTVRPGAPGDGGERPPEALRKALEARLGLDVAFLDPARFARFADRITMAPELFVTFAPLIGLLTRHATAA